MLQFSGPWGSGYGRANYLRANTSGGIMALSMSATGGFKKNEDQDQNEVSCMVHARAPSKLGVPPKGHSFSLPWYRSVDALQFIPILFASPTLPLSKCVDWAMLITSGCIL